jgi:uncharacterized protein YjbI with pentapeptide repeats
VRTVKPTVLGVLTRPFEYRREFHLGIAVTAFVPLGGKPALLAETTMWPFLGGELPPDQPLDAIMPKSHAEFLAKATAYAPGGGAVPQLRAGIKLGTITKTLGVYGERFILGERPTEPKPFTTMPIDWAHAYGGAGVAENPLGLGAQPVETPAGRLLPAANIVTNTPGTGYRTPAGFLPLDQMWPQRARLAGTYGDDWLKNDFPGFPRDIDWRFFNAAPADQQFSGMLRGDEDYALENLHPTQPLITGRLPGIAPRFFIRRKGSAALEEVPLSLTTVWFFPHALRLVLVHHGHARLREEDGADVEIGLLGADRLGAPRPVAEFAEVLARRLDRNNAAQLALRDDLLVPAELVVPDPVLAETAAKMKTGGLTAQRRRRRLEQSHAKIRAAVAEAGHDPDKEVPPLPPERPVPTLDELPDHIAGVQAWADAESARAEAQVAKGKAALTPRFLASVAAVGGTMPDEGAALPAGPKGPPPPAGDAMGPLRELRSKIATLQDDVGTKLDEVKIPPQLTGKIDLSEMEKFRKIEQLAQIDEMLQAVPGPEAAEEVTRKGRNSYRLMAHYQQPADPRPDAQQEALRQLISGDPAAARAHYDFSGADLSGLDLSGRDLSGICLDGANLAGCNFTGARLANAVFAHARMGSCVLDGADLTGANLGKAVLVRAFLRKAALKEAILNGADLRRANLAGADLEKAELLDADLEASDFSGARAPGLLMMKAKLQGWYAPGINLDKAKFLETDLTGANFAGASLFKVAFLTCKLDNADFSSARMRKSVFVKASSARGANFTKADLTGANLRETPLAGADFSVAVLAEADVSKTDLTGAKLPRVNAVSARLTAATLARADLFHGNFWKADLANADLRGANLTEICVQDANMSRVRLDTESRTAGMITTRMRYLPRYQPQAAP